LRAGGEGGTAVIDPAWALAFAREWIAAWNAHDLERIFAHYTDDFEMASPLIVQRMGKASGRLKGKTAIRPYWAAGLAARPPLHFELIDVFAGVDVVAIRYHSITAGRVVIERLRFNSEGLAVDAEALWSAEAGA
jgi:ketosteroid isomerase-like protein